MIALLLVFVFSVSAASADTTSNLDSLVSEGLSLNHHHLSTRSTDSTIPLHLHHLSSTPGNRFLSRAALSSRLFRRRLDLQYDTSLDEDTTHGQIIGASLAIYLRHSVTPGTTLIIKMGEDSITEHTLTEPTSVLLIPLPEAPTSNSLLNITLTATRSTFYKDGAIATTSLPLNQVLSPRNLVPFLVLHFSNPALDTPAARDARQALMERFGASEPAHHRSRRSATFSHCRRHDLTVKFSDIGLDYIVAPFEFNAHQCSGTCHVDHEETPMTNHAFLVNLLFYTGEADSEASCVAGETKPLSVIVSHGEKEFSVSVLEDMVVESCACR
eukprot:sb/3466704/